ncbi:MAG: Inosine-5'-monophosphate dehydrogenase [Anaerolineales bacterium]|nr:Inosine-5'-monophosphate dehydrogenase [Anaerolineales bacterium]
MSEIIPESEKRCVGDVMMADVITVYPSTSVDEIARLMTEHDISGLPVVDEGDEVLGIVTELDMIVRNTRFKMPAFIAFLDAVIYLETPGRYRERVERVLGTTAREIMSEPAVTIGPDASIEDLTELMVDRRMNPVPVVAADRLVGIVSRSDIIRIMTEAQ